MKNSKRCLMQSTFWYLPINHSHRSTHSKAMRQREKKGKCLPGYTAIESGMLH